ncbi:MAG: endonuclease NucS domain-containing protein [Tepidiformaceae bacterium]
MALHKVSGQALELVTPTSYSDEGLKERYDLQPLLRDHPDVLEPGLFIVAEEFGEWIDSRRRIDLLAVDRTGRLVVVELKRRDDESLMDLQAIRYAAMVANMTFEQLVEAHGRHLSRLNNAGDPRERLLRHLGLPAGTEPTIQSSRPRMLLVSADFSTELTTCVLWLNECGLDVRCLRLVPYRIEGHLFLDATQVLPLPEASEYTIRVREKTAEIEAATQARRERTHVRLARLGRWAPGTELVFNFRRLPTGWPYSMDDPRFRATVSNDSSRGTVVWMHDGNAYSVSSLTGVLRDREELPGLPKDLNGYLYWCFASEPEVSLWQVAESGEAPATTDYP